MQQSSEIVLFTPLAFQCVFSLGPEGTKAPLACTVLGSTFLHKNYREKTQNLVKKKDQQSWHGNLRLLPCVRADPASEIEIQGFELFLQSPRVWVGSWVASSLGFGRLFGTEAPRCFCHISYVLRASVFAEGS